MINGLEDLLNMAVLQIENLYKKYGKRQALNGVSLSVEEGSICGLLGLNGAGKSTLMKIVCSQVKADSGNVTVLGKDVKENTVFTNSKTGCLIETPAFFNSLTGFQNLKAVSYLYDEKISDASINQILSDVGLDNQKNIAVRKYSLGMKQRLYFALALMKSPKLLLLDEPFNGIDPLAVKQLRDLIKQTANTGTAVVISSHILSELQMICDKVCIIDKGKDVYSGFCKNDTRLEEIFISYVTNGGKAQ